MTESHERKLSAILSADVAGFSRLMGQDDGRTLLDLHLDRDLIRGQVVLHGGRVVDAVGDNLLADFPSALQAVRCAVAAQQSLTASGTLEHRLRWRMGVHVGDVLIRGQEIAGDGVNIAARIESLALAGGICISGTAYDQVDGKLAVGYAFLGESHLKNIVKPVRIYRIVLDPEAAGKTVVEALAAQSTERPVVCFVDDDPKEIEIFRNVFGQALHVVSATRLSQAFAELKALGKPPDLFLLDLYFPVGRDSTSDERETMARLKADVEIAQKKLSDYLAAIGQDRCGGLNLLEQVRTAYRNVPAVFYTRKGTLDDVTVCLDAGAAAVLRKPQPETLDAQRDLYPQLEAAAMAHRDTMLDKLEALSSSGYLTKKASRNARRKPV